MLVAAVVTLLPLPAKGGRTACADRTHRFALDSGGAMITAKPSLRARTIAPRSVSAFTALRWSWRQRCHQIVQRAARLDHRLRRDVRIGLSRVNVGVAEQHLDDARARSLLDQMRGVGVAERSGRDLLG